MVTQSDQAADANCSMVTITKDNLIDVLDNRSKRIALLKAMNKEHGSNPPLSNLYAELAPACIAAPDQLETVTRSLLEDKRRFEPMLCWLIFHPNMPENMLNLLFARKCCIDSLGHRSGPQWLLEKIAERYRHSEAITTLALKYYSQPEYPTEAFERFLLEHRGDYMLQGNIKRAKYLPEDKAEIVKRVFTEQNG